MSSLPSYICRHVQSARIKISPMGEKFFTALSLLISNG
ncbi:hypothetical protein EVA_20955 [gut metagenome]|uniref:Uncharacterized protein n=1 Tax=gut metagenome TaxID=749906 RepID=J9F922_9ZZZZ